MLWQFALFGPDGLDVTNLRPSDINELVLRGISIAVAFIGIVAFIYILVAGLQYIFAAGNEAKQGEAKKAITAAIIGVFLAAAGFLITDTLLRRLQFDDTIRTESSRSTTPTATNRSTR